MTRLRCTSAAAVLTAGAMVALSSFGIASSSSNVEAPHNVVLVYNGPSVPNTHSAPPTAEFTSWCEAECVGSVALPAIDASTGRTLGTMYVWTKNLDLTGGPIAFGEFIWFDLNNGDIYAHSGEHGTVGAVMDQSVKAPTHLNGDPGAVVAGGGDGTIVGGTGKYSKWTGTYTDRTFVELNFAGGPNYYDQLFFSINPR